MGQIRLLKVFACKNGWPAETRDCQQDGGFDGDEKELDSEGQPESAPGEYHLASAGSKHHHFCYYFFGDKVEKKARERERESGERVRGVAL